MMIRGFFLLLLLLLGGFVLVLLAVWVFFTSRGRGEIGSQQGREPHTPKQILDHPKASKDLEKKLSGLIKKSSGGVEVVTESDPRENIGVMFEKVEPQEQAPLPVPDFLQI